MNALPSPFYVVRGAGFILKNSVLWKYAAAPVAISTLLLGTAYYFLYTYFLDVITGLTGQEWYWQIVYYIVVVALAIVLLIVVFFLFIIVATTLAGPFNDLISEKTEQLVSDEYREEPFSALQLLKDVGRGVYHAVRLLALYLGILVLALPLLLVPGIGHMIFTVITVTLSAYLLAFEYLGYPMDRRRYGFSEKRKFIRSSLTSALGFGLGTVAFAAIPIINILMIPAAAVGGTLLFLDLKTRQE